jgi:hypothetical protein
MPGFEDIKKHENLSGISDFSLDLVDIAKKYSTDNNYAPEQVVSGIGALREIDGLSSELREKAMNLLKKIEKPEPVEVLKEVLEDTEEYDNREKRY